MGVILLVRHAHAGDRADWRGDDRLRPLTEKGRLQSEALVASLNPWRITRILTSPYTRCRQTLEPLARARRMRIEETELLEEGRDPAATLRHLVHVADGHDHAVAACTHGDIIGGVLGAAQARGVDLGDEPRMQKASTWVLETAAGSIRGARYLAPR